METVHRRPPPRRLAVSAGGLITFAGGDLIMPLGRATAVSLVYRPHQADTIGRWQNLDAGQAYLGRLSPRTARPAQNLPRNDGGENDGRPPEGGDPEVAGIP